MQDLGYELPRIPIPRAGAPAPTLAGASGEFLATLISQLFQVLTSA